MHPAHLRVPAHVLRREGRGCGEDSPSMAAPNHCVVPAHACARARGYLGTRVCVACRRKAPTWAQALRAALMPP